MDNQRNNKVLMVLFIVFVVIVSVLCVLFATGTISFKSNDTDNNKLNQNDEISNDLDNEIDIQEEGYQTILLSNKTEIIEFDKFDLEFNGIADEEGNEYFKYVLNIKYDGKDIDNTFFNDKNNYRIWSSNMAADFKVYKVENVYILVSFIAKDCFCNEIMILNANGDVLKTFATSEFSLDGSDIFIKTSNNGQCMGANWEDQVTEYKFKINDSKLIEQ